MNIIFENLLLSNSVFAISATSILIATGVVSVISLIIGVLLGIAAKAFEVEVDEKEVRVRELLPGNNCGGCGYAGCDGLAKAIASNEAAVTACPVANSSIHAEIAKVMGVTADKQERTVAFVNCSGTCDKAGTKYNYYGLSDCRQAVIAPGAGEKACSYGCLGGGSCVNACVFDAIHVVNGIAVVDKEACVSCGKCVAACPKKLIELVPQKQVRKVACHSKDKGKDVMAACQVGCIGCMKCTRVCESDAIHVENSLAKIDYVKCTDCGMCAEICPRGIITKE